ncbi:MAG TPA: SDR family oxidoreductase, partial [Polyangiaceae bacterium]|nr:SDR family oxidoreductase [Polyangiaceae bacterium]
MTGAGRGIGAAVAQHLARLGARVCLTSRSTSEIQDVLASIRAEGGEGAAITADVTVEEDVQRLFEAAHGELGPVSILVNNAGEGFLQPFADTSLEQWNQCVASNMTSMFLC